MGVVESARKPRPHPFCRHLPVPPGGHWGFPNPDGICSASSMSTEGTLGVSFLSDMSKTPTRQDVQEVGSHFDILSQAGNTGKKEKSSFIFILRQTQCCDCINHVHQRHCCSWSLSHWTSSWSSANLHPHRLLEILHVFIWLGKKGQKLTRIQKWGCQGINKHQEE